MKPNPVGWFEIYVQDMARARKFYEGVFQTTLQKLDSPAAAPVPIEMYSFDMAQDQWGAAGSLVKMSGVPSGGNSTLVYFSCADCATEEGRVAAHGGKVERPKMPIGQYGFIALVVDTEGNMIGLHSMQ